MSATVRPSRSTLLRDWITYVLGVFLVTTQSGVPGLFSPPPQPNDTLVWAGLVLVCVQGGYGVASLLASRFGIPGSLLGSQPEQSSGSSSPAE